MKINISIEGWNSLIMSYLFDMMNNEDEIRDEDFREIIEILERKGMRSHLRRYYFGSPSQIRVKYKLFKKVITGDARESSVYVERGETKEKERESILGKTARRVLKTLIREEDEEYVR